MEGNMKRVGLVVAYDGTNYSGWQIQPNGITIQGVLNDALTDLLGEKIEIMGASRTDAGVHALWSTIRLRFAIVSGFFFSSRSRRSVAAQLMIQSTSAVLSRFRSSPFIARLSFGCSPAV